MGKRIKRTIKHGCGKVARPFPKCPQCKKSRAVVMDKCPYCPGNRLVCLTCSYLVREHWNG